MASVFSNQEGLQPVGWNFSGAAITNTNQILAEAVASGVSGGTLDLSGGTNAAPTGQGLIDKATLILAGWTVTTN